MRNKFLLIIAMTMMITAKASAQMIAVNTDVAMDACMAPSLGVELTLERSQPSISTASMLPMHWARTYASPPFSLSGVCISPAVPCSAIM